MTKTLPDYLSEAKNYLYKDQSKSETQKEIQKLMDYTREHKLDKKFLELVESNKEWLDLAETVKPEYYIHSRSFEKKPAFSPASSVTPNIPDIELHIWDNVTSPVPVIKVIFPE